MGRKGTGEQKIKEGRIGGATSHRAKIKKLCIVLILKLQIVTRKTPYVNSSFSDHIY